jgi:hypothetical protein
VKAAGWSALAAWVALLIGLVNLWFAVIRPWWRNRKASPAAQLDLLRYPAQSGGRWQEEEERVVVTNHGPARMRNVSVEVFDQDGRPLAEGLTALWPKMPVEILHVGQSLYLTLATSIAELPPTRAVIRWYDKPQECAVAPGEPVLSPGGLAPISPWWSGRPHWPKPSTRGTPGYGRRWTRSARA